MLTFWLGITIFAIIIEIITVDLVSIWFAIGGVIALLALILGFASSIQIALFIIISAICVVITRPIAKKYLRTNTVSTNSDRVIGRHGKVTKRIDPDSKGEVKVLSTLWSAVSVDNTVLEENDYCEILAIEGAHLIVKKIQK